MSNRSSIDEGINWNTIKPDADGHRMGDSRNGIVVYKVKGRGLWMEHELKQASMRGSVSVGLCNVVDMGELIRPLNRTKEERKKKEGRRDARGSGAGDPQQQQQQQQQQQSRVHQHGTPGGTRSPSG